MSIKVGIIGAGWMADYHIKGCKAAGADVVAISDLSQDTAEAMASQHGIKDIYTDVGEMLAGAKPDAVSIITPNKFHKPLTLQAIEAGCHVFCEKPPGLNAAEVEEMKAAADKAGKTLMFDFNNRARPESLAMMRYIKNGDVGTINSAQASWVRRNGIPGFGGWFTTKALSGGGPVIEGVPIVNLQNTDRRSDPSI